MYRFVVLSLLIGCGANEKKQAPSQEPAEIPNEQSTNMSLAVSSSDIPECTDANKNQLIYVTDLKQFQTCNTTWAEIQMPAVGASSKYSCYGDITAVGIKYYYELTDMPGGDVYAVGSIIDADQEVASSRYHLRGHTHAKYGGVAVVYNKREWHFRFDREIATLGISSRTADLFGDLVKYTQPATECVLIKP